MKSTKGQRNGFFAQNYRLCYAFFLESRLAIKIAFATFALTFLFGFLFPVFFAEEIALFVAGMLASLEHLSPGGLIAFIFFNNLKASFVALITGVGVAIFPVVTAIINGYLLGFISRAAVDAEGILVLWRLLPHGIFELPAILLSIGIGIKIGVDLFRVKQKRSLRENLVEGMRFFVFVVFPLLLVAAIIEGLLISFIT